VRIVINIAKLKGLIAEKGYSQYAVAKKLGVTPKTFYSKMKKGVFSSNEMQAMIEILEIADPAPVFFASKVSYQETNVGDT
jgi:DNA-binding XRE family transcriptional regulator